MVRLPWVVMSRYRYERIQIEVARYDSDVTSLRRELAQAQRQAFEAEKALAVAERRAAIAEVRANILEAGNSDLRQWLEAKDAVILAMKREGFDPPAPQPPTTHEIRAKLDPAILHRIEQIAQPGTKEHFEMMAEAEALIGAYPDRSAEAIADEVTAGSPISPYRL